MSNQHVAKSNPDERGEPTAEKGAEEKSLQKSETLPWTRRLFFHFEIGVKRTTSQPESAVKTTTSQQDHTAAGIPLQQEAAVAQQVLAFPAGAAKPPALAPDNAAAGSGPSTSTTSLYLYASAGNTSAPLDVGGYPGPPR